MKGGAFWRRTGTGIDIRVRLTPKSSRDAIEGSDMLADGTQVLKVRVRAVPEDGKANAALVGLLAKALGVPKSSLAVTGGATARVKTVALRGHDAADRLAGLAVLPGRRPNGAEAKGESR